MVEVQSLTKTFGKLTAVNRVNFRVRPGEVFGLLGENGAGKTTTLRMLATVLTPTSGTARVGDFDLVREPEKVRRQIGVLSGEGGVYDRLTARENVRYFGRLHDVDDATIARRTSELFDILEMNEYADRRAAKFSKGMKQKVSIARTLIHDPMVLLFDEPTAGLDVTSARVVTEIIRRCKEQGKVVIFSSHIMSEVEKLCDRVGIIHKGEIVAEGTLDEITSRSRQGTFEDAFVGLVGGK